MTPTWQTDTPMPDTATCTKVRRLIETQVIVEPGYMPRFRTEEERKTWLEQWAAELLEFFPRPSASGREQRLRAADVSDSMLRLWAGVGGRLHRRAAVLRELWRADGDCDVTQETPTDAIASLLPGECVLILDWDAHRLDLAFRCAACDATTTIEGWRLGDKSVRCECSEVLTITKE